MKDQIKIKNIRPLNWPWDPLHLVLDEDFIYKTTDTYNWKSPDDLINIVEGIWTIKKGFKWNGTTNVPDGPSDPDKPYYPITWKASLIHDVGYRYNKYCGFPYNRKQIDTFLYELLKKAGFKYSLLYYIGVRVFGIFCI